MKSRTHTPKPRYTPRGSKLQLALLTWLFYWAKMLDGLIGIVTFCQLDLKLAMKIAVAKSKRSYIYYDLEGYRNEISIIGEQKKR